MGAQKKLRAPRRVIAGTVLFLFGLTMPAASAGRPAPQGEARGDDASVLVVDVDLVTLPVSVLDRNGQPVHGLEEQHFRVFEDGVEQEISRFRQEDVPISVGLVIDSSGSMNESTKRERVNSAALVFVRESNPDDETFVITFNDEAFLEQDFTRSMGNLMDALDNIYNRGETAVNDAIYLALEHVEAEGRMDKKALLVVSDGEDNASVYTRDEVMERLRESDVSVYAIGLLDPDEGGGLFRKSPAERAREAIEEIVHATGGQAFFPESLDEVEELCRRIARDLRSHYTIEYRPGNGAHDGTLREIEVRVDPPDGFPRIEVRTKTSYRAPEPPR
jgi:VWFA-related protein